MRKQTISAPSREPVAAEKWLSVRDIAEVELTSEDASNPVEAALGPWSGGGWRAAGRP